VSGAVWVAAVAVFYTAVFFGALILAAAVFADPTAFFAVGWIASGAAVFTVQALEVWNRGR